MSHDSTFKVAILADDLTSAADGAGPFVARDLTVHVGRQLLPRAEVDICAVDVASRSVSAGEAGARMARFARELRSSEILLKTVDSTLRGHVRDEIEFAFRASGRNTLVFAPAFPDAGRMTLEGVQLVNGVPVHLSSYGKDPVHPARTARLQDLVPPDVENVLIFDAQTQDDLDRQVEQIERPEDVLWVGSPGLARALARRIGTAVPSGAPEVSHDHPVLVVVGSANEVSHRQANALTSDRAEVLIAPSERRADKAAVLNSLANEAAGKLAAGGFGALIATGGDTMEAILDRAGVRTFALLDEIEPGFPVGSAEISDHTVLLGMKAGGFGDDETLQRAVWQLSRQAKEFTS